jgi:hypothetical protein
MLGFKMELEFNIAPNIVTNSAPNNDIIAPKITHNNDIAPNNDIIAPNNDIAPNIECNAVPNTVDGDQGKNFKKRSYKSVLVFHRKPFNVMTDNVIIG